MDAPEPPRHLGKEGRRLWDSIWGLGKSWIDQQMDVEVVALLCESMDERQMLRLRALKGDDWRDRVALRNLDAQIGSMLSALRLTPADRRALREGVSADEQPGPAGSLTDLRERAARRRAG